MKTIALRAAAIVLAVVPVLALAQPAPDDRATFKVIKSYNDGNPNPVTVTISCNTGLPLEQSAEIEPSQVSPDHVEFVVTNFDSGELDCEITEEVPAGYAPLYVTDLSEQSSENCTFLDVEHGDVAIVETGREIFVNNVCMIGNGLLPSTVTVNKEWIDEHPDHGNSTYARADWVCSNVPNVSNTFNFVVETDNPVTVPQAEEGTLHFNGLTDTESFQTYGNWDGGTHCEIVETDVESNVEVDDSDCSHIMLSPGEDAECTLVNTRIYEGIPTLGQYGLAVLALLMLAVGFAGFRRFA